MALTQSQQSKEIVLSEDEDTDVISVDAVAVAATDAVNAFDALALGTLHSSANVRLVPRSTAPECPRHKITSPSHQFQIAD